MDSKQLSVFPLAGNANGMRNGGHIVLQTFVCKSIRATTASPITSSGILSVNLRNPLLQIAHRQPFLIQGYRKRWTGFETAIT